jgi:ParB family chromosome partitioning protein
MTHQDIAEILGRSRAAVTNILRLLELAPPVRDLLGEGKLDMGHARALLPLPPVRQVALAQEAVARQWSVRDVERRVKLALKHGGSSRTAPRVDRDVARLEDELAARLGTVVRIKSRGRSGRGMLILHYASLDQLQEFIGRISRSK